jgi:putative transposase
VAYCRYAKATYEGGRLYCGVSCDARTVNGERLLGNREKEVLRKMIWQVADFSGVEVLTYCIMSNHFHVLVRVPELVAGTDAELLRRYSVLYPKPTKYQEVSLKGLTLILAAGGEEADRVRLQLLARMTDVSEFMKTLKQRFSVWYNRSHGRYGTLWAECFKSLLVEG